MPSSLPVFPLRLPAELRARLEAVAPGSLNAEIVRRLQASLTASTPAPRALPVSLPLPRLAVVDASACPRAAMHRPGQWCKACASSPS